MLQRLMFFSSNLAHPDVGDMGKKAACHCNPLRVGYNQPSRRARLRWTIYICS